MGAAAIKVNGLPFDDFTVVFPSNQLTTTQIVVLSARLDERSAGVINGTRIDPTALEKELSKISTELQELRRDIGRALLSYFGQPQFTIANGVQDGDLLAKSGNQLVKGIAVGDFADLQGELATEIATRAEADAVINTRLDDMVSTIGDFTTRAEVAADESEAAANAAQVLVLEATAGFSGFQDGLGYDFGYITDPTTYFDQNWGLITS